MKKTLNTSNIANELRGGSSFFQHSPTLPDQKEEGGQLVDQSTDGSTNQPTTSPVDESTGRLIHQKNSRSTYKPIDSSPILGRPKAFYITKKQDDDLDKAVKQLSERVEGKVNQKIDRSTLLRLILEDDEITKKETIDRLVSRLTSRLISQLTN
jgi:hypothetical protein